MRLGALLGPVVFDDRKSLTDQAARLEGAGYDSLWSAQAMGRGFMMTDPFIALTAAAVVTERVELGTAILQLPLYAPVDIALKTFSLLQIAGDRVLLGVGPGSTEVDHQIHDSEFSARFGRFNESLMVLRHWLEQGEYDGRSIDPWPAAKGSAKLLYGTWGKGVERAATEFDGWIASGMHRSAEQLTKTLPRYREADGGRAIVSTLLIGPDTDLGELRDKFQVFEQAGFDDAVVMFTPGAPDAEKVRSLI